MPKQGTSETAPAYACGAIYGAVAAMSLPMNLITPQRWQLYHPI
jgi:hypothetical protein